MTSVRRFGAAGLIALLVAACAAGADRAEAGGLLGLIASDTAADPNPLPFWGTVDCEDATRQQTVAVGGDTNPDGLGAGQGNASYRRMTVFDGDDYWGERCELGWNDTKGPVTFYREGRRRITYISFRLPTNFPLHSPTWQGVLQMKQTQPADNGGGPPVISLSAFAGTWQLWNSPARATWKEKQLWTAPATTGVWTRFAFDVRYSQYKRKGRITIFADVNGDRDFADPGEQSARIKTNTLKRETSGPGKDDYKRGQSIRSHLRTGMYHDPGIPCPAPTGCSVEVDNVQVIAS